MKDQPNKPPTVGTLILVGLLAGVVMLIVHLVGVFRRNVTLVPASAKLQEVKPVPAPVKMEEVKPVPAPLKAEEVKPVSAPLKAEEVKPVSAPVKAEEVKPVSAPVKIEEVKPVAPPVRAAEIATGGEQAVVVVQKGSDEQKQWIEDARRRIREAPEDLYTMEEKADASEAIGKARELVKVGTFHFATGEPILADGEFRKLKQSLEQEEVKTRRNNRAAIFVVLGFADSTGSADGNRQLSRKRAESVMTQMRDECHLNNLIHPITIGSSEVISKTDQRKNRAAEVWLVMP